MLSQTHKLFLTLIFSIISVTAFAQSAAAVEDSPVTCFGGDDGAATATLTGGVGPYNYLWDNGEILPSAINLTAGLHSVEIEDVGAGLLYNTTVTITDLSTEIIASAIEDSPVSCNGFSDGAAIVTVSGGLPPYTYSWDNSTSNAAFANDLVAGLHEITIEDANNCTKIIYVTITEPEILDANAVELSPAVCNGDSNGAAEVIVTGGSLPYTYSWDQSPSTASTANDLASGLHTITVRDANLCEVIVSVTITEPLELTATGTEVSPVNCWGGNDGVASVSVLGGSIPYTFVWDQSGSATNTATDLIAGVHTVTITDVNGCFTTVLITVNEPVNELTAIATLDSDATCFGAADGVATVTVDGGTMPYSFDWDQSTATTATASDLVQGLHTVTVTDVRNCTFVTTVSVGEPTELTATISAFSDVICNGEFNGSITVVPTGGTFPYSYAWDNSLENTGTAIDLGAGLHTITITDANNCEFIITQDITEPEALTVSVIEVLNPICFDDPLGGTITLELGGGTEPYLYSLNGGPVTSYSGSILTITNLVDGSNSVDITDSNNCTPITITENVTIPEEITFDPDSVEVQQICTGSLDGSITLDVGGITINGGTVIVGGVEKYNYTWTYPSGATSTLKNLTNLQESGQYSLSVTDSEGCVAGPFTVDVSLISLAILNPSPATQNLDCYGDTTGAISIQVDANPPGNFSIKWFRNGVDIGRDGQQIVTDLGAGNYSVEVADLNDPLCSVSEFFEITEPEEFTMVVSDITNPPCFDDPLGGTITLELGGGTQPYLYSLNGGPTSSFSGSDLTITNLMDGSNTVEITDSNNCNPMTIVETITFPEEITFDAATVEVQQICLGSLGGSITLDSGGLTINGGTIITGGSQKYNYTWTFPSGATSSLKNLTNLQESGQYSLSVSDSEGCVAGPFTVDVALISLNITNPSPATQSLSCYGDATGSLSIQVVANPPGNFTIKWFKNGIDLGGSGQQIITNLGAGSYSVEVSDLNDPLCSVSEFFEITEPDELIANVTEVVNPLCFDDPQGGIVRLSVEGGTLPYSYRLDGQAAVNFNSSTLEITGLAEGSHIIEVTDASNCNLRTFNTNIVYPLEISINPASITLTDVTCTDVYNGAITLDDGGLTVSGGTPPYTYTWTLPSGGTKITPSISEGEPGVYTLQVQDGAGCLALPYQVELVLNPLAIITQVQNQNLRCNGDTNAEIAIQVNANAGSLLQYDWFKNNTSIPNNTASINNLGAGIYKVVVTDINSGASCFVSEEIEITEPELFTAVQTGYSDPLCFDDPNGGTVTIAFSGGTLPYSYAIDGASPITTMLSTIVVTGLDDGNHNILVTDSNICNETTITQLIIVPEEIVIDYNPADILPVQCSTGGGITVSVSGGTGTDYFYVWAGPSYARSGVNLNSVSGLFNGGTYSLYVYDENNCVSAIETFLVEDDGGSFTVEGTVTQQTCANPNSDASIALTLGSGIVLPYFVKWELWQDDGSGTFDWVELTGSAGQLIINNLDPGEYRATVTSSATTGCTQIIQTFTITDSVIVLFDDNLQPPSCTSGEAEYKFKLNHINPVNFYLDGNLLVVNGPTLKYNPSTEFYTVELMGGAADINYLLRILEQVPTGVPNTFEDGCELFEDILVPAYTEMDYLGDTTVQVDLCAGSSTFQVEDINVIGGTPFIDGVGVPFYNYEWFGPDNYHALGATVPIEPGVYQLIIIDSENCESDPINFTVEPSVPIIEVTSEIGDVSCDAEADGFVAVDITGGMRPYTIVWELESLNGGGNASYTEVARDLLRLNDLEEGRYRLTVTSNIFPCVNENPSYIFQDVYVVNSEKSISVLTEPVYDNELCLGNPGVLSIQVVDTRLGDVNFFYNGTLMTATATSGNNYDIFIDSPVDSAILNVVNDDGCGEEIPIEIGLGDPSFTYDSPGFSMNGILSASEEITFTNTTPDPFDSVEWTFGDGQFPGTGTSATYSYAVPGSYDVTMRVYNALGCFEEITQTLVIGGPHAVQFPTIFTPNNDSFNDYFQAEFAGISSFSMEIYDLWNNLIYAEEFTAGSIPVNWGWDGNLSTGEPFLGKVFKYVFIGVDNGGEEVVVSNQALLLR